MGEPAAAPLCQKAPDIHTCGVPGVDAVREQEIAANAAISSSLNANLIAWSHPAMTSILAPESSKRGYMPCQQN